jgi:TonB-linked SusC/RagA family outer membrane protein
MSKNTMKMYRFWMLLLAASTMLSSAYAQAPPAGSPKANSSSAKQQNILGKVTGADAKPLAGVLVAVKGSTKKTVTDANGLYNIQAAKGDVLVFSYIGFQDQESTITDNVLNVQLIEGNNQLNSVVVTAMGIKKQARSIGYSTTMVEGEKFTQSRETNIGNALTGMVAGVSVAGVATGPSGSSRIIIRGNSSLQGNNQPLYVIDGVPYDHSNQGSAGTWGGADYGDGLSNINPDDIESLQVLKGVAATALYGYRGGNGAILITTKSGAKSKGIGVELNNNFTASNIIDTRDYQYVYGQGSQGIKPMTADAANASAESSWGAKIDGSDAVNFLGQTYKYNAARDNYKNFYNTGLTNQASLSLSGSNDKGHFRLGLSDLYLGSNIPNSTMQQQGLNFNSAYNITNKLLLTLTANYIFEQVKNRASFSDAPGNLIATNQFIANTFDIRWLKPQVDSKRNELLPGSQDIYFENPYFIAYQYQNSTNRNRLTGAVTLKYNLLDWLYVQGQVSRDGYIIDTRVVTPNGVQYSNNNGGNLSLSESNQRELNTSFQVGLNRKLAKELTMNANAGANSQDNLYSSYGMSGGPFTIPFFYSSNNIANRPFSYDYSHSRVNSLYGSIDFAYKNYLFITATGRNDWFSPLFIKTNSQFYPSVSGSFVFSDVLHLPSWISFGKLRASYAQSSNTGAASPYQNVLTYGLQGYTLNSQSLGYVNASTIPNSFLKPVNISEQEIGLNVSFLHDRLVLDMAVYTKNTKDDIVPVTISGTSGYTGNTINVGKLRNTGFEFLITGIPVKTKNFSWNVSWNFGYNNSKVLDLGGAPSLVIDGAVPRNGDAVNVSNVVGLPYGQIMGYKYIRDTKGNIVYNTNPAAGLPGEPLRTANVVPLGSGVYKATGGLSNEFHYKAFALNFLIDYKLGAKLFSGTNLILYGDGMHKNTLQGRETGFVGKGVTEDGKVNTTAVTASTYFNDISYGSDHITEEFLYDASFIKLRSLSLSYTVPAALLKKGFVKAFTVSFVARNLATLLKHTPNIDPESNYNSSNGQGLELSGYPPVRSYGVNLNVKF